MISFCLKTSRRLIDSVFPQADGAIKGAQRRKKGERTHPQNTQFLFVL